MNKPTFKELYYLCVQKLTNFPYIEEDFDALTNYELLCKVVAELNKMITNMNTQNESIIALYNSFNQLKTYIDTYFENLDVQEEINNKIDELVENGTILSIINNDIFSKINRDIIENSIAIGELREETSNKVGKNESNSITEDMLTQEVKEMMTGGSVAVVGLNSVGNENIKNGSISILKLDQKLQDNFVTNYNNVPIDFTYQGYCTLNSSNEFNINTDSNYSYGVINLVKGNIYKFSVYDYMNLVGLFILDSSNNIVYSTEKGVTPITQKDIIIEINDDNLSAYISRKTTANAANWSVFVLNSIMCLSLNKLDVKEPINDINLLKTIENYYCTIAGTDLTKVTITPENGYMTKIYKMNKGLKYRVRSFNYINLVGLVITNNNLIPSYVSSDSQVRPLTSFIYDFTPDSDGYIILSDNTNETANKFISTLEILPLNENKYINKKWVAFGDSLTAKSTLGENIDIYPDYIKNDIKINVFNFGVGGTGYWRGHSESNAFYQRISSIPTDTDVITIFGSFNDLGTEEDISGKTIIGEVTDTGTNTLCGCINTTLDNLFARCSNATVGIISPTPWWSSSDNFKYYGNNQYANEYVEKLEEIAKLRSIPFLNLFKGSNLMPWNETFRTLYYNGDGVHPNTLGQKRFTPLIENFLKSIIY